MSYLNCRIGMASAGSRKKNACFSSTETKLEIVNKLFKGESLDVRTSAVSI